MFIYLIFDMFLYKNMQKHLTNWHKYDRGIWGYECLGIGGFGEK